MPLSILPRKSGLLIAAGSLEVATGSPTPSYQDFSFEVLLQYVLLYLPEHGKAFEEENERSSYEVLYGSFSKNFVNAHKSAWIDNTCASCGDPGLRRFREAGHFDGPAISLWLAIAHGLTLFVQDSLSAQKTMCGSVSKMPRKSLSGIPVPVSRLFKPENNPKLADITAFAIHAAIQLPSLNQDRILQMCLVAQPTIADDSFRIALRVAPLETIKILLLSSRKNRQELVFTSNLELNIYSASEDVKFESDYPIRPLWEIAKRRNEEDAEEIIDLLLNRGEDINGQCGPDGTAIHSLIKNIPDTYGEYVSRLLRVLIRKGADVNAQGPKGKPLEYLWMRANTSGHRKIKYLSMYGKPLRDLIGLGAINKKKDPNGLVPSVERMMSWPDTRGEYEEYKRHYIHFHGIDY